MKRLLTILIFLTLTLTGNSQWYVSTTGDDSAIGSKAAPWKTWGKAFNNSSVQPGDTVWFRGGVYMKAWGEGDYYHADGKSYRIDVGGTDGSYVYYMAYPGETPILDSDDIVPNTTLNYAIRGGQDYTYFKGLSIRNVWSIEGGIGGVSVQAIAWKAEGNNMIIENCDIYNTHGIGLQLNGSSDTITVLNCDAWNHCDSFAISPQLPGNRGSGFTVLVNPTGFDAYYSFIGCRAWNCGDQGFSGGWIGHTKMENCWAFRNGQLQGEGHGYKLGWAIADGTVHDVFNCIAAYNRCDGFRTNDAGKSYVRELNAYNNIAYNNGLLASNYYGFAVFNTTRSDEQELLRDFKNNISYQSNNRNIYVTTGAVYTHSNNSWDIPLTFTDNDFLSVDSTGLTGARGSDGSLPDLDFLKLASESQAIGAGVDVGLIYDADSVEYDDPPAIGPYEYVAQNPAVLPTVVTVLAYNVSRTQVNVLGQVSDDGGGTISERGACYNTTGSPDINDDAVASLSESNNYISFLTGLDPETTYYIKAYATNEAGTSYGEETVITTLNKVVMFGSDGKPIFINGKIIYK